MYQKLLKNTIFEVFMGLSRGLIDCNRPEKQAEGSTNYGTHELNALKTGNRVEGGHQCV